MTDTTTTLYAPSSTPSQRLAAAAHRARLANMASKARNDSDVVITDPVASLHYPPQPPLSIWLTVAHEVGGRGRKLSVEDVQAEVARYFGTSIAQICSVSRNPDLVMARHVAMYLARKLLPALSLPMIARRFGDRDHTTVRHGAMKIEEQRRKDPVLARHIEAITFDLGVNCVDLGEGAP